MLETGHLYLYGIFIVAMILLAIDYQFNIRKGKRK